MKWPTKKLGGIKGIQWIGGGTPSRKVKSYFEGSIPWFTVTDIPENYGHLLFASKSRQSITEEAVKKSAAKLIPEGAVLLTARVAPGKVAIVNNQLTTNQDFVSFLLPEEIDRKFFAYCLIALHDSLLKHSRGATIRGITRKALKDIEIPLPPLLEQRRIVKKIEEIEGKVREAKRLREEALEDAKLLLPSYLHQIFSGAEEKKWPTKKLGEVCRMVSGVGFPKGYQGNQELPYLFLKVSDMNILGNERSITTTKNTIDNRIRHALQATVCPSGTVIFPKVGGAVLTNKKRILGKEAAFDNNVMGLVPDTSVIEAEWLYLFMLSIDLASLAQTTALPSINQKTMKNIEIPLSPLPEQRRIVKKVEEVEEKAKELIEAQKESLRDLEALMPSVLAKAFADML